jgi:hypothetical protein
MDQVVANSSKSYPMNPFDALDNKSKNELLNSNWAYGGGLIEYSRNDGNITSWMYSPSTGEIESY